MLISEEMDYVEERSRFILRKAVQCDRDFQPAIMVVRGDQEVALISTPDVNDGDELLHIARLAAGGFAADILTLVHDSYHARTPLSPITGQPWGDGELQHVAEYHDGIKKGWLEDALVITSINRAGDFRARSLPYTVVCGDVEWGTREDMPHTMHMTGRAVEKQLREFMDEPPVDIYGPDMPSPAKPNRREFLDCATARFINSNHHAMVMLQAREGSDRHDRLAEAALSFDSMVKVEKAPIWSDN